MPLAPSPAYGDSYNKHLTLEVRNKLISVKA